MIYGKGREKESRKEGRVMNCILFALQIKPKYSSFSVPFFLGEFRFRLGKFNKQTSTCLSGRF